MDSGLWYIFSIYTAAQEQSHRPVHSPLFPPRLSPVPCLLKNMEGKCQVCHFSLSHPLSSFFPPSGSVLPLPVRLSFTVLSHLASGLVHRFAHMSFFVLLSISV